MIELCINKHNFNLSEHKSQVFGAPYVRPNMLIKYLDRYQVPYSTVDLDNAGHDSWYVVNIYFFDLHCDYFTYFKDKVLDKIRKKQLRVLFCYSEPDELKDIAERLEKLCSQHNIDRQSVFFLSGNSSANYIDGFGYLQEHELLYGEQNQNIAALACHLTNKEKKYTCLSRTHKLFRAEFIFNLDDQNLIDDAYVSYGNVANLDTADNEYSILEAIPDKILKMVPNGWASQFMSRSDDLNTDQHNDHSISVTPHHTNSYWNVVLETFLDCSDHGVFFSEKTFKPIKYGQAFIILGCPYSLELLRDQGYKTFSNWVDETYDSIVDVRERWLAVYDLVSTIARTPCDRLHQIYQSMLPAIHHNQQHFRRNKADLIARALVKISQS